MYTQSPNPDYYVMTLVKYYTQSKDWYLFSTSKDHMNKRAVSCGQCPVIEYKLPSHCMSGVCITDYGIMTSILYFQLHRKAKQNAICWIFKVVTNTLLNHTHRFALLRFLWFNNDVFNDNTDDLSYKAQLGMHFGIINLLQSRHFVHGKRVYVNCVWFKLADFPTPGVVRSSSD